MKNKYYADVYGSDMNALDTCIEKAFEIADAENMPSALQMIEFYHDSQVDISQTGHDFKTHQSFAWKNSANKEKTKNALAKTIEDTKIVVAIDYSFPFFYRVTDRYIFAKMPKLKKVYVQDINPDVVVQTIQVVLPSDRKIAVEPIKDCGQFYLPAEL